MSSARRSSNGARRRGHRIGSKSIAHTTDSSRLLPYRTAARRRSSALVAGSASPQDQGHKDRRQGPHDPELAEGPEGDVIQQDQDDAAEQDDRGGRGDDRAAVQAALAQQR